MFRKSHLDNGMTVVMEQMRNVRSVALGIWVKVGSRHEPREQSGISHFLEHMFFKGSRKRDARDIAFEIDSLGGEFNAFTSKEGTTFYVKILDEHLERGADLLTDVFLHPAFPEEELEREKGVIREEIKLVEDTPDDYVHDLFSRNVWGGDGLGQPVLGRRETVRKFTRDDLLGHIRKYYGIADTVVSCSGNFDPDFLLDLLNRSLGGLRRGSEPRAGEPPAFRTRTAIHQKDLSEVHICVGVQGIEQSSPSRYCLLILNTMLGGGISSRLFQEIREKRGLAYSVYSFLSSYRDTGLWAVYAGTGRKRMAEVIEHVRRIMSEFPEAMDEAELQRAKDQLKGNLVLGLESTGSRMQNIANQEIYYGRYFPPSEIMKSIDAVTLSEARSLAEELIKGKNAALTVLGPADDRHLKESSLLL
ncbi:MAG: pitrilysin family protein [Thermodesulfovibrionales bacterium]